jgi:hypothetical protein
MRAVFVIFASTVLIAVTALVSHPSARAQATVRLEELQIDLWPEFDRPDMLVIYRGRLSGDTSLPATLTLTLPAGVGQPHAVAYDDGTGNLFETPYTTENTGDTSRLTFETPQDNFQVEFYDTLSLAGDTRSYTLLWHADYTVDQLNLLLLAPPGATAVQTAPPMTPIQRGADSFSYVGSRENVAAGQEVPITISYDGALEGIGLAAPATESESVNYTPFIVGGAIAAVLLVVGAGLWYTRRSEGQMATTPAAMRTSRNPKRRAPKKPRPGTASRVAFCSHCGHLLQSEDRFCGNCGKPVKERSGANR